MANPYDSVSVAATYNASPPPDDGSAVAANQLDWDFHKDKLADPLKTALESINSNNVTAHARQFGGTFETKTTAYTVQAPGDRGKIFSVTGTTTITLPAVADAGDGFPVAIVNTGSATVTVDGDGAETINGSANVTLEPNAALLITSDGSSWGGFESRRKTTGSFSAAVTGGTGGSATTFNYEIRENLVTIHNRTVANVVTSTSTALTLPSLPAAVQPGNTVVIPCIVVNNGIGNHESGQVTISGSTMTFAMGSPLSSTGFTASGVKGLPIGWSITYPLT